MCVIQMTLLPECFHQLHKFTSKILHLRVDEPPSFIIKCNNKNTYMLEILLPTVGAIIFCFVLKIFIFDIFFLSTRFVGLSFQSTSVYFLYAPFIFFINESKNIFLKLRSMFEASLSLPSLCLPLKLRI